MASTWQAAGTGQRTRWIPRGFLSQAVYSTCFSISYGVALPTLLVASFVPRNNSLVNGLVDGAQAARTDAAKIAERRAARRAEEMDERIAQGKENALIEESAYTLAAVL